MLGALKLERDPGFPPRTIFETVSTLKKWDNLVFTLLTLKLLESLQIRCFDSSYYRFIYTVLYIDEF